MKYLSHLSHSFGIYFILWSLIQWHYINFVAHIVPAFTTGSINIDPVSHQYTPINVGCIMEGGDVEHTILW